MVSCSPRCRSCGAVGLFPERCRDTGARSVGQRRSRGPQLPAPCASSRLSAGSTGSSSSQPLLGYCLPEIGISFERTGWSPRAASSSASGFARSPRPSARPRSSSYVRRWRRASMRSLRRWRRKLLRCGLASTPQLRWSHRRRFSSSMVPPLS